MNLIHKTATELAQGIRQREFSASEVLEAHISHFEKHNPQVNAIVTTDIEKARQQALQLDEAIHHGRIVGPLHGVPMTVKDSFDVVGMPTTAGIPFTKSFPQRNATVVERLQQAGAIVWGKTNVPLGCYDWQCKHPHYGRTNNPWNLDCTPGGSSGGSAAAVAANFTPLEMGSDVAGSIRVPAHFCGISALRPTEGIISNSGHGQIKGFPFSLLNYLTCGPMARSVADLKLAMEVICGIDHRDWRNAPLLQSKTVNSLKGLRIAWYDELGGIKPSQQITTALHKLVEKLQNAGAIVEKKLPEDINFVKVLKIWGEIQGFEMSVHLPWILRTIPMKWLIRMGFIQYRFGWSNFSHGFAKGLTSSARNYFKAQEMRNAYIEKMENFLQQYDAWICPVAATAAFSHCRTGASIPIDGKKVPYSAAIAMYSATTAYMGNPIAVVPTTTTENGLPIAIQIHGPRWTDYKVLDIAQLIEDQCGRLQQKSL